MNRFLVYMIAVLILSAALSGKAEGEENQSVNKKKQSLFRLTENDIILPLTSIEWGVPDRWSFTSRYIHSFGDQKKKTSWKNGAGLSLSPGWSGGRIGVDYIGIYLREDMKDFALFTQFRGTILRTWGNPLSAEADETYLGAEVKFCISWLLDIGAGYYYPLSDKDGEPFFGFHFGVGI